MSDYNIKYFDTTMDIIFEPTKKVFNAYKSLPNLEFEFRLGKKNGSMFDTNIGEEKFNKIKEALENYQEWEEKSVHYYTKILGGTRMKDQTLYRKIREAVYQATKQNERNLCVD